MNVIPNNIQAKEFRYRAECRDQLQHKGDLYVGTGITEEVTLDDGTTKNMCKTEPLYRTTDGLVPASDDSNKPTNGMALVIDNSNSTGWKVGQVETAGIKDGAITEAKLSKEYYIKNNSIDFTADRLTGALPHISWSKQSNIAGRPSTLTLQAPLQSAERTTTILNFPVTNSTNTLATKEQVERGEIVAKTAQNATNATNAENTDFTNAEWSDNVESATLTAGLYQILISSTYTYLFHYDGRTTIGNAGGDIVSLTASSPSAPEQIYITTHTPSVSNSVLTISAKTYTISTNGFALYDSGNQHFKYRKIR